jgi:hypothetical protein
MRITHLGLPVMLTSGMRLSIYQRFANFTALCRLPG